MLLDSVLGKKSKCHVGGKVLTIDKVNAALDLLVSQQLLINISFFGSNRGALIEGVKEK